MAGRAGNPPPTPASIYEANVLAPWQPWIDALIEQDMTAQRRSLRLWPKDFTWRWCENNILELNFHLMRGSYATALIRELAQAQTP